MTLTAANNPPANADAQDIIAHALAELEANNPNQTDGKWLERITVNAAPHLKDWDIDQAWGWSDWPERETHFPNNTQQDVGIDAVAIRSDGALIAIQCKARQLDENGQGDDIHKDELNKFIAATTKSILEERWVVTNGDNRMGENATQLAQMDERGRPVKLTNIHADLIEQQNAAVPPESSDTPAAAALRSKQSMQDDAVATSVQKLRKQVESNSGDIPVGEARGRLILPCGTGKTRISLRIIEELTPPGELAVVLCPSIALVAQIRREYLQNAAGSLRALAVCSDESAGYDPKRESSRNTATDPTIDNGNVRASVVKGKVTTDPDEIARWMQDDDAAGQLSVVFGTYQSGHRIAQALRQTGLTAQVLVADEAHRTAGLRRRKKDDENARLRDFTLCHDNQQFPAVYRLYQTATPRIYDPQKVDFDKAGDWIVRTMDDESVFGVELYRKSYREAVANGWLSDYRIIALGVNDPEAYAAANELAAATESKGRQSLTTTHFLRGLAFALAMGGGAKDADAEPLPIKSCIAFMNTVDKSRNMANHLEEPRVRDWLKGRLANEGNGQTAADYRLKHLDATSDVTARNAARRLLKEAAADAAKPHGILNVGIFGEGTDAPSLSAVAFLEARRSPIDVVQAVGRVMRTAPGKKIGYIICPIVIPPDADPETWLSVSGPEDGWQELAQILLALRAHDSRIEDELAGLMRFNLPANPPELVRVLVAIAAGPDKRIVYRQHIGRPGQAEAAVRRVVNGESSVAEEFQPIDETETALADPDAPPPLEPSLIITGHQNSDGSPEVREDSVRRHKPAADGAPGKVDFKKSKDHAKDMINKGRGIPVRPSSPKPKPPKPPNGQPPLPVDPEIANAITMNVLDKSGLTNNRVDRDLNLLRAGIREATHHLHNDELLPVLNQHFGLDNLKSESLSKQADGCTIAALLLMNAMMLHQRIANGGWLEKSGIISLETIKNDTDVIGTILSQWEAIIGHDFKPVIDPAMQAIHAIQRTGKQGGLERALHHLAAAAEDIAETYADMGADHAGPLFNQVMGNQASDGAFFTRPAAASIAARLTLDACSSTGDAGESPAAAPDWTSPAVWRQHKAVDLACGSGTLLAALLTDLKRRARQQGAAPGQIAALQKIAVEETLKGMDINPVSLQLAASQLTAGNHDIRYRKMGLHLMPYGPQPGAPAPIAAGTLELLGQQAIVPRAGAMDLGDDQIRSQAVWQDAHNPELEDAVDAAQAARIVIMNPPFTNRAKMGEKFPAETQRMLRARADALEQTLVNSDPELRDFVDKNSIAPLFVGLADKCVLPNNACLTMIHPTVALSNPSGLDERRILAQRWHIHTILTCHQPGQINLSQNTNINESIIVAVRHDGPKPPTRFINLDRMAIDDTEVDHFHQCLAQCEQGEIADGWGEVSWWPAERIAAGDWTPAIWRSPELAEAAARFANDASMSTLQESGLAPVRTDVVPSTGFEKVTPTTFGGSFPVLYSKDAESQTRIQSQPDEYMAPKNRDETIRQANGGNYPEVVKLLQKAGHLLITAGQDNRTARLTAVADDEKFVGNSFRPVPELPPAEAKALAVFINSTPGRLQLLRNQGRKLEYPMYHAAGIGNIRIPDVKDARIRQILAGCWEATRDEEVPQFRDGECGVRQEWDAAVAAALGWDGAELTRLRQLLHQEPHVRGLGYNQYADAVEG